MKSDKHSREPLRILHLEDSPLDAELIRERLSDAGFDLHLDLAKNERQFTAFLEKGEYDLVLADYHLPDFEGEAAFRLVKRSCPEVPFICVSGAIGEEKAVELIKQGATDYVSKSRLDKLLLAITRALDEAGERAAHRLAEENLRKAHFDYQILADTGQALIWTADTDKLCNYFNKVWLEFTGRTLEQEMGNGWAEGVHPDDFQRCLEGYITAFDNREAFSMDYRLRRHDGEYRWIQDDGSPRYDMNGTFAGYIGYCLDITRLKQAEEEKVRLETQLLQAQKMESIGLLAGGVAHDFNNMLGVILGHAELGLMRLDPDHPLYADLHEIRKAAERSAELTRQLLAFARKQIVSPKVLSLNDTLSAILTMLQRLIGEDIQLAWQPSPELWQINIDPTQIDQIMANLCVNARDAIENTGHITILTENRSLAADYCAAHPYALPGDYVRIVVRDDGLGMDNDTLARIFEPFFTTKEQYKGTGLGLATVYGIVKQNNGLIDVESQPGRGTTFSLYFPRYKGESSPEPAERVELDNLHGQETILLVEDEHAILNIVAMMLEEQGYTVLKAGKAGEAIRLAREHNGDIHLLMTDVIMPEMNGKDLADNLLAKYPQMKRLFMSGYTADIIAHHGVLEEGVNFIEKPFKLPSMVAMVRKVLDRH